MDANQSDFSLDIGFSGLSSNRTYFTNIILGYLQDSSENMLLEIGCGDGKQLYELASKTSYIRMTGIDISSKNISNAQISTQDFKNRVNLFCHDFALLNDFKCNILIADSVIHNIESPTRVIFQKLSDVVCNDGVAIISLPKNCFYNEMLFIARRFFALIKSSWFEEIVCIVGKLLNKNEITKEQLRERIPYIYKVPTLIWNVNTLNQLKLYGFDVIGEFSYPHSSAVQPKHTTVILKKK